MGHIIIIIRVQDGKEVSIPYDTAWDEVNEFLWTEGNYACDCNRHYFFNNWEDGTIKCSDNLYKIRVVDLQGHILYKE